MIFTVLFRIPLLINVSIIIFSQANPIRTYSGIYPSPSEKMLTVPQGPRLHTESRRRGSDDLPRADSRGSMRSDYSDVQPVVYSAYSYNGPTVL